MLENDGRPASSGGRTAPSVTSVASSLAARYSACHPRAGDLRPVAWRALRTALESGPAPRRVSLRHHLIAAIVLELRRHLRERPAPADDLARAVARAREQLRRDRGRQPTVADLCRQLARSEEDVLVALAEGRARRLGARADASAPRRAA